MESVPSADWKQLSTAEEAAPKASASPRSSGICAISRKSDAKDFRETVEGGRMEEGVAKIGVELT